jgi:hypothetical protein
MGKGFSDLYLYQNALYCKGSLKIEELKKNALISVSAFLRSYSGQIEYLAEWY